MKSVTAILILLCAYLHATDNLKIKTGDVLKDAVSDIGGVVSNVTHTVIPDCIFGVRSVSIVLYTRDIPYGKNIGVNEVCDDFNPSMPIIFLVHGFISNSNYTNSYKLSEALVQKGSTVFSLDWSDAACTTGLPVVKFLGYPAAVQNTREIGEHMASYVISMIKKCNVSLDNMIFIGHSLGAHVSGFASKNIQNMGYGKVPLLFGADPAQPLFMLNKCEDRLCKEDADTTIVLHTSALGITHPIGTIDLYFDGGSMQPKCFMNIACSHSRAVFYLAQVVENDNCIFPGVPMSYPNVISQFHKPRYPQSNTSECLVLDDTWFWMYGKNKKFDNLKEKVYYMFVDKNTMCTNDNLSCQD